MSSQGILGKNRMLEYIRRAGLSATVFFGAFAIAFLSVSNFTPASDSSATDVEISNSPVGQYMNINTLGNINIDLAASPTGETSIAQDTLTIDTNIRSGYRIYISAPENADDTSLHHTDDSVTKKIAAVSGTLEHPGKLGKNSWGYTLSRKSGLEKSESYDKDDVDPEDGQEVVAGMPSYENAEEVFQNTHPLRKGTNTVDIYYSVNADTSMPSGSYQTNVLYTAVIDDTDQGSGASVAPANQKGIAAGQELVISTDLYPGSANPSFGTISVKVGDNTCTSPTPTVTEKGNLNISCIAPAQTKAKKYDVTVSIENYHREYTINEGYEYIYSQIGILQDFDCSSIEVGEEIDLRDIRDNKIYPVKHTNDGYCWLLEDLHITGPRTLTPEDTDITTGSFTLGESDQSNWCTQISAECFDQSKYLDETDSGGTTRYNWYTATAGTFPYVVDSNNSSSGFPTAGTASGSICPRGWHLPTYDDDRYTYAGAANDFYGLAMTYNKGSGDGGRSDGNVINLGEGMDYWLGTASGDQAWLKYYNANPGQYNGDPGIDGGSYLDIQRYHKYAVRCYAADPMPHFSCSDISEIGGTKDLIDYRNGRTYGVVKAKDGKCWTTSNQRLIYPNDKINNTSNQYRYYYTTSNAQTDWSIGPPTNDWCEPGKSCSLSNSKHVLDSLNPSYGTYYAWFNIAKDSSSAPSFCPNNWHIPSKQEWQDLYDSYGSVKALLDSPLKLEFAGYHLGSETLEEGQGGYFWSTTTETGGPYAFHIDKTSHSISQYNSYYGFSARCVASK